MASDGVYSVTLDEAIEAMRLTAADMSVKYKETSLSVRLLSVAPLASFHQCSFRDFIQGLAVSTRYVSDVYTIDECSTDDCADTTDCPSLLSILHCIESINCLHRS